MGEIRALTGVRGIAACFVVIFHVMNRTLLPEPLRNIVGHGYLSVDLFFALSGFVLGLHYGPAVAGHFSIVGYVRFWVKRIERIYPLYFVSSIIWLHPAALGIIYPVSNLLLIQSWMLSPSLNRMAWSISAEWFAYAIFPVLSLLTLGRSARLAVCCGITALLAVFLLVILPPSIVPYKNPEWGPLNQYLWQSPAPLIRCVASFSLGLLTLRVTQAAGPPAFKWAILCQTVLLFMIVALAAVPSSDFFIVALMPPLIWSLSSDEGPVAALLGSRPVHYLGLLSYSIYMVHTSVMPLYDTVVDSLSSDSPLASDLVGTAAVLATTIAFATLTYPVFERGGRWLIRRLFDALSSGSLALASRSRSTS